MINFKNLIISILIPNIIGFLGGWLGGSFNGFNGIIQPSFTPPAFIFPIVWAILYLLMGISSYIIYESNNANKNETLTVYAIQLLLNAFWSLFFFKLNWFLFSFIWLILILILVIVMIYKFYKINKTSAYLQIPYVLWLVFASIINFCVYLLN